MYRGFIPRQLLEYVYPKGVLQLDIPYAVKIYIPQFQINFSQVYGKFHPPQSRQPILEEFSSSSPSTMYLRLLKT